jgi:hypothetical protein
MLGSSQRVVWGTAGRPASMCGSSHFPMPPMSQGVVEFELYAHLRDNWLCSSTHVHFLNGQVAQHSDTRGSRYSG